MRWARGGQGAFRVQSSDRPPPLTVGPEAAFLGQPSSVVKGPYAVKGTACPSRLSVLSLPPWPVSWGPAAMTALYSTTLLSVLGPLSGLEK